MHEPGVHTNFTFAECNTNEQKLLFLLIIIYNRFGSCKIGCLNLVKRKFLVQFSVDLDGKIDTKNSPPPDLEYKFPIEDAFQSLICTCQMKVRVCVDNELL